MQRLGMFGFPRFLGSMCVHMNPSKRKKPGENLGMLCVLLKMTTLDHTCVSGAGIVLIETFCVKSVVVHCIGGMRPHKL